MHSRSPLTEEEQMAAIENEESVRRFLKGFPMLKELLATLDCETRAFTGCTIFDHRSLLYRVFRDLKRSRFS